MKYAYIYVYFSHSVSVEDIEAVRTGRQTEGLRKYTEESLEGRAFSILFKGRQKNLDLIASSEEEAKNWVIGLEKVISNMNNLTPQKKTEQYLFKHLLC